MAPPNLAFALDHLTVTDTTPMQLAEVAHETGCSRICPFMRSMDVLPRMPRFDLVADALLRRETRARMDALGVALDVAYPFTLAGRTEAEELRPALDCAAELGARFINVLSYDREPARRADRFGRLCELARGSGLGVVVEFFPLSQVRSLSDALSLVKQVNAPGGVGVNVDLLHLMRSGGSLAELAAAPRHHILYGQLCDSPPRVEPDEWNHEASFERLLPGDGGFDLRGFVAALPPGCPVSIELPRDSAILAGVAAVGRARAAVERTRAALAMMASTSP